MLSTKSQINLDSRLHGNDTLLVILSFLRKQESNNHNLNLRKFSTLDIESWNCLENNFLTPSLTLPPRGGGLGGGDFHGLRLPAGREG
jgi:hypothetical protein